MSFVATKSKQTISRRRSVKTSLAVAGAGVLAFALGACSSADQANAYTDALNSVQLKINSVVSATSSTEAYQSALDTNLPALKTDLQQLQAAQANLSGDAQVIAQECTGDINAIVNGLQSISAAVKAKDNKAVNSARETTNAEIEDLKSCINRWNANNGTSSP